MRFQEYEERPDTTDYAIGDVHGFADHLLGALDWCARDAEASGRRARIHLLGDYVDRGPDSRRVVDILMAGPGADHVEWLPLRGNHDHVFAAVCRDHRYELAREW